MALGKCYAQNLVNANEVANQPGRGDGVKGAGFRGYESGKFIR